MPDIQRRRGAADVRLRSSLDEATLPPDQLAVDVGADGTTCVSVRKGGSAAGKAQVLLSARDGVLFDYLTVDVVAGSDYPAAPAAPAAARGAFHAAAVVAVAVAAAGRVDVAMAMESNAMAPEIIAAIVVLLIVVPIICVVGCICVFGKEKVASVVERSRRKRAPVGPSPRRGHSADFRRCLHRPSRSSPTRRRAPRRRRCCRRPRTRRHQGLTMIGV